MQQPFPPPPQRGQDNSHGRTLRYQDVTELLRSACAELGLGQMVHPTRFSLLDSMACISIGDPRLDSGVYPLPADLIPQSDRIHDSFSSASASDDFNPHTPLDIQETIWIMDRLASCHVAFQTGAPLSQTLFTSLYFHHLPSMQPDNAEPKHFYNNILRAYLLATVRCIGMAWNELIKGNLTEGEDVITETCQLSLYQDVPMGYVLGELNEAIASVIDRRSQSIDDQEAPLLEALVIRLHIIHHMSTIFTLFDEHLSTSQYEPAPPTILFQQVHNLTRQTAGLLDKIAPTEQPTDLTLRFPDLKHAPSRHAASSFDPLYARRLENAGGIPPRPTDLPPPAEMIRSWTHLLNQWKQAVAIYVTIVSNPSQVRPGGWESIQILCDTSGILLEEKPNLPYARSTWQTCLSPPTNPHPSFLIDFLSSHTNQPRSVLERALLNAMRTRAHSPSDAVTTWQNKADSLLSNHLLNSMSSRPRQKRLLAKALARWRSFVTETEKFADYLIESTADTNEADRFSNVVEMVMKPFALAAQAQAARMALTLVLSAFDLELYSRNEYGVAYWMAWQIGLGWEQLQEQLAEFGSNDGQDQASLSSMSLLISVLEIWFHLSQMQSPPASPAHALPPSQSTFIRRFKWLKLSSRDRHGVLQDPHSELKDFWEGFTSAQSQSQSQAAHSPDQLTHLADRLEQLPDRIQALQTIIVDRANPKGRMFHICREDSHALLQRLLQSVQTTLVYLQDLSTSQQPRRCVFDFAKSKTIHPWFPPLVIQH